VSQVKELSAVISTRPSRIGPTGVVMAALSVLLVTGCGEQPAATPAATVTTSSVSPECLQALRAELDGALYRPDDQTETLPECAAESEDAIGAAAEQIVRDAFDSPSATPVPSR
jgi:hypothetical protein